MIKANEPNRKSWIHVPKDSDFPIQNIPFGVFKKQMKKICVGSRNWRSSNRLKCPAKTKLL